MHASRSIPPVLVGSHAPACYPEEGEEALRYFRGWFDAPGGPAWPLDQAAKRRTRKNGQREWIGLVAPHIDFRVSERAYAAAFASWFEHPPADVYVILGVGHRARRPWCADPRPWRTILGETPVDVSAVESLNRACPGLDADARAFHGEHSIEFPVVLLQAYERLRARQEGRPDHPFRILPLLCGGLAEYVFLDEEPAPGDTLDRLARGLADWVASAQAAGQRVQWIVSIDGCHIGPRFQHPFRVNELVLQDTALWEEALWASAEANDLASFLNWLRRERNGRNFDGVGALALLMRVFGERLHLRRTHYEQWFEPRDASLVTFSSGTLELAP